MSKTPAVSASVETSNDAHSTRLAYLPLVVIAAAAGLSVAFTLWLRSGQARPAINRDLAKAAEADLASRQYRPLSGPLKALLSDPNYKPIATQAHPLLGEMAPDFTLTSVDGRPWTLSKELAEGPVVLVFYYGYHCDHCVSQLFGLNKDLDKFKELGVKVVAVSADPPELTKERYEQYGAFGFPVLSDGDNRVASQYGVLIPASSPDAKGDLLHGTFVIDRLGRVIWTNRGDGPFTENRTLLLVSHSTSAP